MDSILFHTKQRRNNDNTKFGTKAGTQFGTKGNTHTHFSLQKSVWKCLKRRLVHNAFVIHHPVMFSDLTRANFLIEFVSSDHRVHCDKIQRLVSFAPMKQSFFHRREIQHLGICMIEIEATHFCHCFSIVQTISVILWST